MKRNLLFCILILLILITPFIYSDKLYNGLISAKQIWFYGAMGLLILAFSIDLLFHKKRVSFALNVIDIALLVFYTYFLIRAVFTPFTPLLYNTRFINYFLLLLFYFMVRHVKANWSENIKPNLAVSNENEEKNYKIFFNEIIVGFLILTGLVQAVLGLLQLYGILPSFHSGFKISGTFFNPAPYALYLAAIFPIALGRLLLINELKNERINNLTTINTANLFSSFSQFFHSITPSFLIHKISYYISLLTVIAIVLVLPATMNRASWLGVAAGSFIVLNYKYDFLQSIKSFLNNTARKLLAFIIVILLVGLSCAGLYLLKKGSSDGRLLIWEVSLRKIAEKPLFGYGVGRFDAEYNNWQADYFKSNPSEMDGPKGMVAGNTKYCYNEYFEMTCEIGIVGLLLFFSVITSVFIAYNKELGTVHPIDKKLRTHDVPIKTQSNDIQNSFISLFFISSLISMLVCALISFPFYSLPTIIAFFFLLALLSSNTKPILVPKGLLDSCFIRNVTYVAAFIILLPVSVLLLLMTRQQFKSFNTWNLAVMQYQILNYKEACKSFSEIYSPLQYTGDYLQYYGKALSMDEFYPQSIELLERAELFTSDDVLYTSLGDNYKVLENYSKAEKEYQYATFMIPHKLYSRYLLANLYIKTGQHEKALQTAKEILSKRVKVKSVASEEIKQAMKELIEKSNKMGSSEN